MALQNQGSNTVKAGVATVPTPPPYGQQTTFLQAFAAKFYSLPGVATTADKIISVGDKVGSARDTVVQGATSIGTNVLGQVNFISKYGLYIVIAGAILYFLTISGGLAALTRRK